MKECRLLVHHSPFFFLFADALPGKSGEWQDGNSVEPRFLYLYIGIIQSKILVSYIKLSYICLSILLSQKRRMLRRETNLLYNPFFCQYLVKWKVSPGYPVFSSKYDEGFVGV